MQCIDSYNMPIEFPYSVTHFSTASATEPAPEPEPSESTQPSEIASSPPTQTPVQAKPVVCGGKLVLAPGKPVLLSTQNLLNTPALLLQQGGKTVLLQNVKPLAHPVIPQQVQQHAIGHPVRILLKYIFLLIEGFLYSSFANRDCDWI